jgi:hypothetical protein
VTDIHAHSIGQMAERIAAAREAFWRSSIAHILEQVEEADRQMQPVVRELGRLGWTVPLWAPAVLPAVILRRIEAERIDELFTNTYRKDRYSRFRALVKGILARQAVARWKPLLKQCAGAFGRKRYLIVVPSLLLILEGLLASSDDSLGRRIPPHKVARRQFDRSNRFRAALWASIQAFIEAVFESRDFSEPRPPMLNRHWILHGRDETCWTEADCLRLFQAIDTLSYIVEFGPQSEGEAS